MSGSNFALETHTAEKLHKAIEEALPKVSSREKAEVAQIVINTLSRMSIPNLANFNNTMVDYIALPRKSKEAVLIRLCVKITEVIIG